MSHKNGAPAAEAPPRPAALPLIPENIPAALRERPQFVCWRYELRTDAKGEAKWTKVPLGPDGSPASSTDPATWGTFAEALAAYRAGGYDGIGFVFAAADPYCGIDLDDCRDPATGELEPWAEDIVNDVPGYAEVSPSGTGVKLITRAKKPTDRCRTKYKTGEVEIYDQARYFCLTGHVLPQSDPSIPDGQRGVDAVCAEVFAPKPRAEPAGQNGKGSAFRGEARGGDCPLPLNQGERKRWACMNAKATARTRALWAGDTSAYDGDDSRADAALCRYLAVLTNGDRDRMEQLFGESALGQRAKWTDRDDYRERTLNLALDSFEPWEDDPATRKPRAAPKAPRPAADGQEQGDQERTPATVIREWLQDHYAFTFRRGAKYWSASEGGEVGKSEVQPDDEVIARLAAEFAGINKKTKEPDMDGMPRLYREWFPVAWGQLKKLLPQESAGGEVVPTAEAEFRVRLTELLKTVVSLKGRYTRGSDEQADIERKPLIAFAVAFAKGRWGDVRGLDIWSRREADGRIRIAFRSDLIGELRATGWGKMTHDRLSDLCQHYGCGKPIHVLGKKFRAIELAPDFQEELLGTLTEPEAPKQDRGTPPRPAREENERPCVLNRSQDEATQEVKAGRQAGRSEKTPPNVLLNVLKKQDATQDDSAQNPPTSCQASCTEEKLSGEAPPSTEGGWEDIPPLCADELPWASLKASAAADKAKEPPPPTGGIPPDVAAVIEAIAESEGPPPSTGP